MLFLPVFATVLFLFGFPTNVPGVVNGLVITNRREPLSTDATIESNTIIKRQLNIIPRGISPSLITPRPPFSNPGSPGGRKQGDPPEPEKTDQQSGDSTSESSGDGSGGAFDLNPPDGGDPSHPCQNKNFTEKEKCECRIEHGIGASLQC